VDQIAKIQMAENTSDWYLLSRLAGYNFEMQYQRRKVQKQLHM
jgi:hypothetical protein